MMKTCATVVAVVLALVASGCGSGQPITEAKSITGAVPKTRLIMATLQSSERE